MGGYAESGEEAEGHVWCAEGRVRGRKSVGREQEEREKGKVTGVVMDDG